jgi:hypothetical protein
MDMRRKQEFNQMKFLKLLSFAVFALFLAGCAKELEEKLPDHADRDIHPLTSFQSTVIIETTSASNTPFLQTSKTIEQNLLAVNEIPKRSVRMIEGPENLHVLFQGLLIESREAGERFEVIFRLRNNQLQALLKVDNPSNLSTISREIMRPLGGNYVVPLFHFGNIQYGRYIARLNHLNEETHIRDFETVDQASASHVRFVATRENRRLDGLYGDTHQRLFLKERLHQQNWDATEIASMLSLYADKDSIDTMSQFGNDVQVRIIENRIYVYRIVPRSSLTPLKERFLETGDPRITLCDDSMKSRAFLPASDECVLEAILTQEINHVRLDLRMENGEATGSVVVRRDADFRQAALIEIPIERQVRTFRFQDLSPVDEENIFRRQSLENTIHNRRDIERIMNIRLGNTELVKTKVLGSNLLFMVPRAMETLSSFERAAFESGDARFDHCPQEILRLWQEMDQCVLITTHYRPLQHAELRLRTNENQDLADVIVDLNTDRSRSQLFRIETQTAPAQYRYNQVGGIGDQILTVKSRDFDFDSEYLYVPMTQGVPRDILGARPFTQGSEKIVSLRLTREGLEVIERDRDERFQANLQNQRPVLLIPGQHIGLTCVTDAQGDCTMSERVNSDLSWDQAPLFIPQFERMQKSEVNRLDLMSQESNPCLQHLNTRLVQTTIEKGVLNIELEKTYKTLTSPRCINEYILADTHNFSGLSSAGFNVRFHYSLIKLDSLISPDYEAIPYPLDEQRAFGFFKSYERGLNDFFERQRYQESFLLNRWNPNRREIVYHLGQGFAEPGQQLFLQATRDSVAGINRSLNEANAQFTIRLVEPSDKKPGDIRYNVIELITDPNRNGLLGYAPTIKNPRTGEIVSGHINMFSGAVRSLTPRVWDSMVAHKRRERLAAISAARTARNTPASITSEAEVSPSEILQRMKYIDHSLPETDHIVQSLEDHRLGDNQILSTTQNMMLDRLRRTSPLNYVERRELSRLELRAKAEREKLEELSNINAYAVEFFQVSGTINALLPGLAAIQGVLNRDQTLKRWTELSDAQKLEAGNIIMPYVYKAVFVHEFGHNLGLRHNFAGSFDAANFYTEQEARARGLSNTPTSSSIMDYAFSELNELTIFGKYDIAALRFAYAREVELNDGQFVPVTSGLSEIQNRRNFRYCTDQNADLSLHCSRFDEGTTITEITEHLIRRYEDSYTPIHFRDGRTNFKEGQVRSIVFQRMAFFERMRDVFEEWEHFTTIVGVPAMHTGCHPPNSGLLCDMVNDRKNAALIAGRYLLQIAKMPDHLCAIQIGGEESPVETIALRDLYENLLKNHPEYRDRFPLSCFDSDLAQILRRGISLRRGAPAQPAIVVAESGRFFNDVRGNYSDQIYAEDRAVVGSWMDRLLAIRALVSREQSRSTTESGHMAFIDHFQIGPEFMGLMAHLLLDEKLERPMPFTDRAGNKINIAYSVNKMIINPLSDDLGDVKEYFGLNMRSGAQTHFVQAVMNMISKYSVTDDAHMRESSIQFANNFSVRKHDLTDHVNSEHVFSTISRNKLYSAAVNQVFATEIILGLQSREILSNVKQTQPQLYQQVARARLTQAVHVNNRLEAEFMALPESVIQRFIEIQAEIRQVGSILLTSYFDHSTATLLINILRTSNEERFNELLNLRHEMRFGIPDNVEGLERALWMVDFEHFQLDARGLLNPKIQHYEQVLPFLIETINY